jgi:FkbM family methyltransferase
MIKKTTHMLRPKQYEKYFTPEQIRVKTQECLDTSKEWRWDAANHPEEMYQTFRKQIKGMSMILDELVFFDVGAAEGCYSCSVIEFCHKATIVAFEPDRPRNERFKQNADFYIEHFQRDKDKINIDIYESVLSDTTGQKIDLRHYMCPDTQGGAGSSRCGGIELPNRHAVDISYASTTLDDYIKDYAKVDVVKIDVEGAEAAVMRGAQKFLEKFKPTIFLEVHVDKSFGGVTFKDVWDIVSKYNVDYDPRLIKAFDGLIEYHVFIPRKIERGQ